MLSDKQFVFLQHLLPKRLLTGLVGRVAHSRLKWIRSPFIKRFIRAYQVDMTEAANPDPDSYATFVEFFTRELKPGARPIDPDGNAMVCPADGAISQLGVITGGRIFQAKGKNFSARELLGVSEDRARIFEGGTFATIYLSPRDYHRVHMPVDGTLVETTYIPGKLYSVNDATARELDGLFARNERLVCWFDTPVGPMAYVMVAAMIVGGMKVVWSDNVVPSPLKLETRSYADQQVRLAKGDELGRFELGSTVIVLFGKNALRWKEALSAGSQVKMGEAMAQLQS